MRYHLKLLDVPTGGLIRELDGSRISRATQRRIAELVAEDFSEAHPEVRVQFVTVDLEATVASLSVPTDSEQHGTVTALIARIREIAMSKEEASPPTEAAAAEAPSEFVSPTPDTTGAGSDSPGPAAPPAADAGTSGIQETPMPV